MAPLSNLLAFAEDLARRAGEITLRHFGKPIDFHRKSDLSPVTVADRQSEEFLRAEIARRFPDHGILGEEFGAARPDAEWQWILDPIDGTKAFIRGVPLYGVLVALEQRGESRLGVIHHPALRQTASAEVGRGAFLNGEPIRVADAANREETLILLTNPATLFQRRPAFYIELMKEYPLQRTWADCYGYTLVASGRAQAMMDPIMNRWDLAALKPIVEEAGGVFTDLRGTPTARGAHCLAATPKVHAEILALLRAFGD
ncbi:MAG: inositol monophosphatase family protein [Candidatus Sumerlaeota bacterium]|nr:inositol monophosphatase family protein [Candidatus Sumerlaeota bacterium]